MYPTTADFVADVELVFSNALQFNEDNSPVWIAAQTLRPMFHKLLTELPPEYAPSATLTQPPGRGAGQSQGGHKIKLRMQPKADAATTPSTTPATPSAAPSQAPAPHAGDQTLQQISTNTVTASTPAPSTNRQRQKTVAPPPAATAAPLPVPVKPSHLQPQTSQYQYPPSATPTTHHRTAAPAVYHPQPQFPAPTTALTSHPTGMATGRSYSQYPPTPPVAPRSPTPEMTPSTTIRSITLITAPAGRTIVFHGTGDSGGVSIRYWAVRLGCNETAVKLRMDVEKGPDEEDMEEDESTTGTESSVVVDAEGKKFSTAVKLNGTHLPPAPQRAARKTSTPAPDMVMADGTKEDVPKTNGHNDGGAASGSESEDESGKGKGPAARATRSGKVPTPSMKNGKARRKRRAKKAGGMIVGIDLGPWEASLVVGSNVLDVRAGGKDGERWRVFVDRVL